jgi:hypothetical protein
VEAPSTDSIRRALRAGSLLRRRLRPGLAARAVRPLHRCESIEGLRRLATLTELGRIGVLTVEEVASKKADVLLGSLDDSTRTTPAR